MGGWYCVVDWHDPGTRIILTVSMNLFMPSCREMQDYCVHAGKRMPVSYARPMSHAAADSFSTAQTNQVGKGKDWEYLWTLDF